MKKIILHLNLLLLSTATAFAQGPPPPDGGDGPGQVDDVVPIDDHIWILIIFALLIGIYMVRTRVSTQTLR